LGTTSGGFVRLLNSQASYLSGIGQNVTDVSRLWSFLIAQSANYWPVRALGAAVDGSLPTPGNLSLSLSRAFNASIPGRFQAGPFGLGWHTSWQQRLEIAADGTVTRVTGGGGRFTYQPDRRSTTRHFSATGDQDVLTAISGGYKLTALDGTITFFKTDGTLDYLQDTNGNRITVGYAGGRLTSLTASSGQSLTLAYNGAGLISTLTDSAGRVTTYSYDPSNQYLISVTAHSGLVTAYAYNTSVGAAARNALTAITRPDGTHQYLTYDSQGRLAGTSADGGTSGEYPHLCRGQGQHHRRHREDHQPVFQSERADGENHRSGGKCHLPDARQQV
jgi:YD repeat-containing protein